MSFYVLWHIGRVRVPKSWGSEFAPHSGLLPFLFLSKLNITCPISKVDIINYRCSLKKSGKICRGYVNSTKCWQKTRQFSKRVVIIFFFPVEQFVLYSNSINASNKSKWRSAFWMFDTCWMLWQQCHAYLHLRIHFGFTKMTNFLKGTSTK